MKINYTSKNNRPSLFNFLSVLVCVMATLIFLSAVISMTSLDFAQRNIQVNVDYGTENESGNSIVLECTFGVATSLDGKIVFNKWTEENVNDKLDNTPFTLFLREISDSPNQDYIFFLVRPDGIDIYNILSTTINNWNRNMSSNYASFHEKLNEDKFELLPEKLKQRISFNNYKSTSSLTISKKINEYELNLLSELFNTAESKNIVNKLFNNSQTAKSWTDFGSELVPEGWNVKVNFENETSKKVIKIEK